MQINQCVIFCGGRGERLAPLTDHLPKPMALVNGGPFLDYLLQSLKDAGIRKILFLTGYKAEIITKYYYGYSDREGFTLEESRGTVEDQTGRRLLNAYKDLDEHFLLCYGDNYLPEIPLQEMLKQYQESNCQIQTTVFDNKLGTGEYRIENNVMVGENRKCALYYDKSRKYVGLNGVDIGYFLFSKSVLKNNYELCTRNFSFETEILGNLALMGCLSAYVIDQQYYWITDIDSLRVFEKVVFNKNYKPINWRE